MIKYNGKKIKLEISGESHGDRIYIKISGMDKGIEIDIPKLQNFMRRRHGEGSPVSELCSTGRKEPDSVIFDNGLKIKDNIGIIEEDVIEAHIENIDVRSKDYEPIKTKLRPGHSDLGAYLKYGSEGLKPGSGEFSGRMTAGICVAGGIAKQILKEQGIEVSSEISTIGTFGFSDMKIDSDDDMSELKMYLQGIKERGDSLGGSVSCTVKGMPAGIGGPYFERLESAFAYALLGIPSAKAIEFGSGIEGSKSIGSRNNDEYYLEHENIVSHSNNHGGISGGISTGMDIDLKIYFKPVSSIRIPQKTVDISSMEETEIEVKGRHDICIVPRVLPVVESLASLVVLDRLMEVEYGK